MRRFPDNMLLFMSDKAAGGSGEREQIKGIILELFTSEAVVARGKDEVRNRPPESNAKCFQARRIYVNAESAAGASQGSLPEETGCYLPPRMLPVDYISLPGLFY